MRRISAFLVTLVLAAGIVAAPSPASAAWSCPQSPGNVAGKNVAVLVHGWLGVDMEPSRPILQAELGDGWTVVTFDYQALNTLWPSSSVVAQCLSNFAFQIQESTGNSEPSVYIVGHSMGGLMARFGLNSESADAAASIGGVVTLDTPHTGSPWGASMLGRIWQTANNWTGGGDAAKCLALHHPGSFPPGCAYPPALPESIPVAQVAGNVTLTRTWFTTGRDQVDTMSDGIVWLDSQVGYKKSLDKPPANTVESSYVVRCEYAWGSAVATASNLFGDIGSTATASYRWWTGETFNLIQSGSPAFTTDKNAAAVLAAAGSGSSCGHNAIKTNPEALRATAAYLNGWADSKPTEILEVNPFTPDGTLLPEWTVDETRLAGDPVSCGSVPEAAIGGITANTLRCGSTADGTFACWAPPTRPGQLVCTRDPSKNELFAVGATDITATEPMNPLQPLYLRLVDGSEWIARSGGSWGGRADGYTGAYSCVTSCTDDSQVILERDAPAVNMTTSSWTVMVGPLGNPDDSFPEPGELVVETAWFIASTMAAPKG